MNLARSSENIIGRKTLPYLVVSGRKALKESLKKRILKYQDMEKAFVSIWSRLQSIFSSRTIEQFEKDWGNRMNVITEEYLPAKKWKVTLQQSTI